MASLRTRMIYYIMIIVQQQYVYTFPNNQVDMSGTYIEIRHIMQIVDGLSMYIH